MKPSIAAILVVSVVATLTVDTSASRQFISRIPNGANVPNVEAVGHSDGTGDSSARNAFGSDFEDAGNEWTVSLCQMDSDGDGQTNGQELGDPCCEWTKGGTPQRTSGISHPSDSTKTSNESLWANVTCTTTAGPTDAGSNMGSHSAAVATMTVAVAALVGGWTILV